MKIALIGYGKMGQLIESLAVNAGHKVPLIIHEHNLAELTIEHLRTCDVAIEFSTPKAVISNINVCAEAQIPVVVGTTGWYDQFEVVQQSILNHNATLLHATNFSLGVNLFFKLNQDLAQLMNPYLEQYTVGMMEIHHTQKLDAPSGTAISLAEQIINNQTKYSKWDLKSDVPLRTDNTLEIEALRIPNVPGTHTVTYSSTVDQIEITHTAHNRNGFAVGAIMAAEWVIGKKGIFSMQDVLA